MDFLLDELSAIPYIIGGVLLLFIGMLISDAVTGSADRFWKRKS